MLDYTEIEEMADAKAIEADYSLTYNIESRIIAERSGSVDYYEGGY